MSETLSPNEEQPQPTEEAETLSRQLPIEWYVPDSLVSGYATNVTLQRTEHEFILSFYEQRVPILMGSPEEIQAKVEKLDSVRVTCFARVIIADSRFPAVIEVLQKALQDMQPEQESENAYE